MTEELYDLVVIGGGMGGLTAAAYAAKAGRKVALFEHHRRLGGCCTSFYRKGFTFDAAVHAIGSCHEGGMFRQILEDLDLWDRVGIQRADPMDVIVSPEFEVPIWVENERFIDALEKAFPHEIDRLVKMVDVIRNFGPEMYGQWGKATYREFLDHYIQDDGARLVFMAPLGNIGLPSYRIGAINGCTLFRENQLNGGYRPKGGFQKLANAFGKRIEEYGGEVHLSTDVKRVEVKDGKVEYVVVQHSRGKKPERRLKCRAVVCNASVKHLTEDLIGLDSTPSEYTDSIGTMEPSLSSGTLFLGVNTELGKHIKYDGLYWYLPEVNSKVLDGCFEEDVIKNTMFSSKGPVYMAFQSVKDPGTAPEGKGTIVAISPAVYKTRDYWKENKHKLEEAMIGRVAQFAPWVRENIEWQESATSATVERYTRNYEGAWYGWASTPEQSNLRRLDRHTPFANLWLAGHWTRPGPGVVQASKSGQMTARVVLRELRKLDKA